MNIIKISSAVFCAVLLSVAQPSPETEQKAKVPHTSRTFTFNHADVQGYGDNPNAISIDGFVQNDSLEIRLDRSFKQELSNNVDKETVQRMF